MMEDYWTIWRFKEQCYTCTGNLMKHVRTDHQKINIIGDFFGSKAIFTKQSMISSKTICNKNNFKGCGS